MILESFNRAEMSSKNFLIVHNLKDLSDPEQLPEIWRKEIFKLYGEISQRSLEKIQKMIIGNKEISKKIHVFIKKNSCFKRVITHIALINDSYQKGYEYNRFALEYIKKYLIFENTGKIINDFQSFFCKKVKKCTGREVEIRDSGIVLMNFKESFEVLNFLNHNWCKSSDSSKKFMNMKISDKNLTVSIDVPGVSQGIEIKCFNGFTSVTTSRIENDFQYRTESKLRFGKSVLEYKIPKTFNHLEPEAKLNNGRLDIVYKPFKEKSIEVNLE